MAKILVIDDDPDIITAARLTLEEAGHTVVEAANGTIGLERIKAERPDLIILDVIMDTHTEGFELARKLRNPDPSSALKEYGGIPILMLTAIQSAMPLNVEPDVDSLPVELFVDKPINPETLARRVQWMLDRAPA
jgi:CheY-like chemotaxis protein